MGSIFYPVFWGTGAIVESKTKSSIGTIYTRCGYYSTFASTSQSHVVSVPEYFFLCISHRIYIIQYNGMGFQKYPQVAFGHAFTNRFFVVCFGHLVWMGILFLHRMALGGKAQTRLCGSFKFLYSVPRIQINRNKFFDSTDRRCNSYRFFDQFCIEYMVEPKRFPYKTPE